MVPIVPAVATTLAAKARISASASALPSRIDRGAVNATRPVFDVTESRSMLPVNSTSRIFPLAEANTRPVPVTSISRLPVSPMVPVVAVN